ncbi:amino acid adenylation domain-containing protein [Pseudoalteromonas rubra]|uniref:Amino acid adenylation domain-containing protein n=1 Tax=Pseudoalteromonas rubra TaxID=43658 RepID=A0A5S3UUX9_9GAMM|nr:non-ribosomal peptide synthetase [Pseudoalteromonas rubra]QPB84363.1 amino acid adenylation domain-containing protein [Pseudoalteromonas rubra]
MTIERQKLLELTLAKKGIALPKKTTIKVRENKPYYAQSDAQKRLWLIDRLDPGNATYNMPFAIRIKSKLDFNVLEESINKVVMRHEILRTHFDEVDGEPVQIIQSELDVKVDLFDLLDSDASSIDSEIEAIVDREAQKPFDLRTGPLLRISIINISEDDFVLFIAIHHIIGDAWSFKVLIDELISIYEHALEGSEAPLKKLTIQYADFSEWIKDSVSSEQLEGQIEFWKSYLDSAPNSLTLPVDYHRHGALTQAGASIAINIPFDVADNVKKIASEYNASAFMVYFTAFNALMSRYSGSTDIVVGTPVSSRTREELQPLIGLFINTLPLRTDLSGDPSFSELLSRVRESNLAAFANQELPFDRLVDEVGIERRSGKTPLINTMFSFSEDSASVDERIHYIPTEVRTSKFDLSIDVVQKADSVQIAVEYSTELFDAPTIQRLLNHYQRVLIEGIASPDSLVSQLSLMSDEEVQDIISDWSQGKVVEIPAGNEFQRFEQQVQERPDAVAVVDSSGSSSYQALADKVDNISKLLQQQNVTTGDVIAVCMESSSDLIASMLAITKSGAAFLLMDINSPKERLSYILKDANAKVVLSTQQYTSLCSDFAHVIDVAITASTDLKARPPVSLDPEAIAYVVYTSGSTGKPKGVEISHKALSNLVHWQQEQFKITENDRSTQLAGVSFDAVILETWAYFTQGASIYIADADIKRSPSLLVKWLQDNEITIAFVPTPLVSSILDATWPSDTPLKSVLTGGDTLHHLPTPKTPFKLYNLYGPSENTVVTSYKELSHYMSKAMKPPIGKPINNVRALVLDKHLQVVPPGVIGDLYVGGVGLTAQFRNQPELSKTQFESISLPGEGEKVRLYKTGDKVRLLDNGDIDFIGRVDHQVSLRGYRIELAEVEAALYEYNAISKAVVITDTSSNGETKLVAFIEFLAGNKKTAQEVRAFLQTRLPAFMLPAQFVFLDSIPLTNNGKIDRNALVIPKEVSTDAELIHASTPTEEIIASIWGDVLGITEVGIHDNFFSLGGHSLLVTKVVSRIEGVLKTELPVKSLFDEPTIAALAKGVDNKRWDENKAASSPIVVLQDSERENITPSFSQQRLLFLEQLDPNTPTYNVPGAYRLSGNLDVAALQYAFDQLIQRHEILRTTFSIDQQHNVFQVISAAKPAIIVQTNLDTITDEQKESHLKTFLNEESQQPFNLITGPLFRINLVRYSQTEHVLLFNIHHIITDGWSMGILFDELSEFYRAYIEQRPSLLKSISVQYGDFSVWQMQRLRFGFLIQLRQYWLQQLKDAPKEINLPTDRPRRPNQSLDGDVVEFHINETCTAKLKSIAVKNNATMFMVLMGAFKILLSKYSGQNDIVVGTPVANRNQEELENIIGFFVNMLPMRTDLEGDPTFNELVVRVRDMAIGAYEHQDLPFAQLVQLVSPDHRWHRSPIFQVMFVLQNAPTGDIELPGLRLSTVALENKTSKVDLTLVMHEDNGGLNAAFEYNVDLFDRITIKRMVSHFENLLHNLVEDIDKPISKVSLLTPDEYEQIINIWGKGEVVQPSAEDVCCLFEQQALQSPDSIALVEDHKMMTYRQVDERSNQLANYFSSKKIGSGDIVAIALNRSMDMIVSFIATLKVGAAFLPLDIKNPKARIKHIIDNSNSSVVVTKSEFNDLLPDDISQVIHLDIAEEEITAHSNIAPARKIDMNSLVYVISTSGSTGNPKNVSVQHKALMNLVNWQKREFKVTSKDRASQIAGASFDASMLEIWVYLISGASVYILSDEVTKSPNDLIDALTQSEITIAQMATPLTEACLNEEWPETPELRAVITGGAALTKAPSASASFKLYNVYGPAENTVATTFTVVPSIEESQETPSIGSPIDGVQVYVLDSALSPVPVGVVGELYIGGMNLSQGYINALEETEQRFIASPFNDQEKLYHSGDLVRYRKNGELEFLGRMDDQISIRGFRVELGEVAKAINNLNEVQQTFIQTQEVSQNQHIIAYVVLSESAELTESELLEALKQVIPVYMLPSAIVFMDELPKNVNGKVDKSKLPLPSAERFDDEASIIPINDGFEQELAEIWGRLLNYKVTSMGDDFFKRGGHSILAMTLKSEIRMKFGVNVNLVNLFEDATLKNLATSIKTSEDKVVEGEQYFGDVELAEVKEEKGVLEKILGMFTKRRKDKGDDDRLLPKVDELNAGKSLVTFQSKGGLSPLFCIHPVSGEVTAYVELARRLGQDRPIYGLQLPSNLNGGESRTIELLAAHYAYAIKSLNQHQPVNLMGWSMGGVIAFEVAQQLEKMGVSVQSLNLIDSYPYDHEIKDNDLNEASLFGSFVREVSILNEGTDDFAWESENDTVDDNEIEGALKKLQSSNTLSMDLDLNEFRKRWLNYRANTQALSQYHPKPYQGKLSLIMASEEVNEDESSPLKHWAKFSTGGMTIDVVPADHYTILKGASLKLISDKLINSMSI